MWRDFLVYAWRGSFSRAGAWAPLAGVPLVWFLLWWFGRTDVILPTTLLGALEFSLACAGTVWLLVFFGRLIYAPYHFLRQARSQLALHAAAALEILFDPADEAYVRP